MPQVQQVPQVLRERRVHLGLQEIPEQRVLLVLLVHSEHQDSLVQPDQLDNQGHLGNQVLKDHLVPRDRPVSQVCQVLMVSKALQEHRDLRGV